VQIRKNQKFAFAGLSELMTTQASYQIKVKGRLTTDWEDWFNGIKLQVEETVDGSYVTCLESSAIDQTALHGILAKIRDMNLILLSVNPIVSIFEERR
jgi:hypothetical protein